MAIKVTNREVDVETEILQKLSEFGLSIDFDSDDSETEEEVEETTKETKEEE